MNTANKVFRVALIGCGAISGNHVNAILSAGQTLCALCDVEIHRAKALAEKFDLQELPLYTDYKEMLDREHPDALHIATPHYLHAEMVTEALGRNIHVLCEKPIGISLDQLEAIKKAVSQSSAQLGICQQNRYEPMMLRLKELAKDGVKGGNGYVVWKRDAAYYRSGAWRGTWAEEGGGVMINQALHTLDILQWICGMPTHVTAHCANDSLKGVIEVEDTASARFETADGTVLHFYATNSAGTSFPVHLEIKLASGESVLATNKFLAYGSKIETAPEEAPHVGKAVWGSGHVRLIKDFYRCLAENQPFPIGIEEAEKVIRLILAMYRSQGERIEV